MSFFFSVLSFFFKLWERERERGYIKLGIRRNSLKVYLSFFFFSTGFLWRIFPLLRANRLYTIFSTGLKKWLLRVRDIFLSSSTRSTWLLVPSTTNPVQQLTLSFPFFADGKKVPLPFLGSQPIIWLLPSSFLCQATRGRSPSTNGHSLTACYC